MSAPDREKVADEAVLNALTRAIFTGDFYGMAEHVLSSLRSEGFEVLRRDSLPSSTHYDPSSWNRPAWAHPAQRAREDGS